MRIGLNWSWQASNVNYTIINASSVQPILDEGTLGRDVPLHIGWQDNWHYLYNCTVMNFSLPLYVSYWWNVSQLSGEKVFHITSKWWNLSGSLFYQYIFLNASYFPNPQHPYHEWNITISSGILVSQYFNWANSPCIPLEQRQWWILDMQLNVMMIIRDRMGKVCSVSQEMMMF